MITIAHGGSIDLDTYWLHFCKLCPTVSFVLFIAKTFRMKKKNNRPISACIAPRNVSVEIILLLLSTLSAKWTVSKQAINKSINMSLKSAKWVWNGEMLFSNPKMFVHKKIFYSFENIVVFIWLPFVRHSLCLSNSINKLLCTETII